MTTVCFSATPTRPCCVGLLLLVLPLLPFIGTEINGARIWIQLDLGGRSFSFQPAEIAKIVLIVFFAGYLVVKRDVLALARSRVMGIDLPRGRDLGPILVAWAASLAVLVFQRDLGTSLLFFGLFVAMLYIATERRSWIFIGGLLFAAGALVAYQLFDSRPAASRASGSTRSPTSPVTDSRSPRASTASPAAASSASGSVRDTPTSCPSPRPTSSWPPSARSSV